MSPEVSSFIYTRKWSFMTFKSITLDQFAPPPKLRSLIHQLWSKPTYPSLLIFLVSSSHLLLVSTKTMVLFSFSLMISSIRRISLGGGKLSILKEVHGYGHTFIVTEALCPIYIATRKNTCMNAWSLSTFLHLKKYYKYSDNQLCEWKKTFFRKTDRLILNEHIHTAPNWKSLAG